MNGCDETGRRPQTPLADLARELREVREQLDYFTNVLSTSVEPPLERLLGPPAAAEFADRLAATMYELDTALAVVDSGRERRRAEATEETGRFVDWVAGRLEGSRAGFAAFRRDGFIVAAARGHRGNQLEEFIEHDLGGTVEGPPSQAVIRGDGP